MANQKIKILGAILELPAKQPCQFGQFGQILRYLNGLDWQWGLAGSSKNGSQDFSLPA